jgi:hypothetical protein
MGLPLIKLILTIQLVMLIYISESKLIDKILKSIYFILNFMITLFILIGL